MQVYLADGRLLIAQGVFSVFAPMIGGADNDAVSEYFLARCGKKAVDVTFLQAVVFVVELALDSVIFAGAGFGDQINTGIAAIQALQFCPFAIRPNVTVQIAVAGLVTQVAQDQFFKVSAFFPLGGGGETIAIE